jgi:hypothetical protein
MVGFPNLSQQTPTQLLDKVYQVPSSVKSQNPRQLTPYRMLYTNWYKTIPYGFSVSTPPITAADIAANPALAALAIGNNGPQNYFFPVNPESIQIQTPFANEVTPTLGGIVEEHSGAVFYNITISGTTGTLPDISYLTGKSQDPEVAGRPTAAKEGFLDGIGFGGATASLVSNAFSAIMGTSSKTVDSQRNTTNGYTAFHVLYKYLWLYKFSKANGAKTQLLFVNYKDNNQYNVVIKSFNLSRDKSRPHLYQYSISMRGYKLSTSAEAPTPLSATERLTQLGLNTPPSLKASLYRVITQTKSVLSAFTADSILNTASQDTVI